MSCDIQVVGISILIITRLEKASSLSFILEMSAPAQPGVVEARNSRRFLKIDLFMASAGITGAMDLARLNT